MSTTHNFSERHPFRLGFFTGALLLGTLISETSAAQDPSVAWDKPPNASYLIDVNTVIPLSWTISNWNIRSPQLDYGRTWVEFAIDPNVTGFPNGWQSPFAQFGEPPHVTADGTFSFSLNFTNRNYSVYNPYGVATNIYFRAVYDDRGFGPYYSPVVQTIVTAHAPEIVSVSPTTVDMCCWTNVTLVTKWFAPSIKFPSGNISIFLNGVSWSGHSYGTTGFPAVDGGAVISVPPSSTTGPVDITITNPDGQSVTAFAAFTYVRAGVPLPPSISIVAPTDGPTTGGTAVTINGANFENGAAVQFDTVAATDVIVSADGNSLTCTTPAHLAGVVNVTVTNPSGLSATKTAGFTFGITVTSITPDSGPVTGNDLVTITGTGFAPTGVIVVFGDGKQGFFVTVKDSTKLICHTPAHVAGIVDVAVFNPGPNGTVGDGALKAQAYTYKESRVTLRFKEKYTRTVTAATKDKPALQTDSGSCVITGTMDITGLDPKTFQDSTNLAIGTGSPGNFAHSRSLSCDPHFLPGTSTTVRCDDWDDWGAAKIKQASTTLSWSKNTLKFQVSIQYRRQVPLPVGQILDAGLWFVAQDYVTQTFGTKTGTWDADFSFGTPGANVHGHPFAPYLVTRTAGKGKITINVTGATP